MRLLALFVALMPSVLADFPNPTVFQMDGFDINVFSDKLCITDDSYMFAFKLRTNGPHSSISCTTKTTKPLYPIHCQLVEGEECAGCRLETVDSEYFPNSARKNQPCVWGIPHNLLDSDTDGLKALQQHYSQAIRGKHITVWHAHSPEDYKVLPIPDRPAADTEVHSIYG